MRVNGYRCDACCKEHLMDATIISQFLSEGLPSTWFTLLQGAGRESKEPLVFCSVKCLWDWAEKQITGLREVVPMAEENTRWKDW